MIGGVSYHPEGLTYHGEGFFYPDPLLKLIAFTQNENSQKRALKIKANIIGNSSP